MYAVIRRYAFDPRNASEIGRKVQEGFVPLIQGAPGFVAYYWFETGPGSGASVTVFQDEAGARASVSLAAGFVIAELTDLMGEPEVLRGPVRAHA